MTTPGPYTQSYNFTHMFDIPDLRGPFPVQEPIKGSILGVIVSIPEFSKFRYIIHRALLDDFFNAPQADCTVFVPTNSAIENYITDDVLVNMDVYTARKIVKNAYVEKRLSSEVLKDSPISHLYLTTDPIDRLTIMNVQNETFINGGVKVLLWDLPANNGIIHVIDNLILPYDMTM
jgi:uncharacterized surface protein with fasciclin (FAS1) repeats